MKKGLMAFFQPAICAAWRPGLNHMVPRRTCGMKGVNMQGRASVPAIRFAGFTDAWEQRKLGDVCAVSSGVMGDSLLTEGQYHLTRIETIADGVVDEKRVGYSNQKPDECYRLNAGDILYSNINSIPHMGKVAKYQGMSVLYHGINLLIATIKKIAKG